MGFDQMVGRQKDNEKVPADNLFGMFLLAKEKERYLPD